MAVITNTASLESQVNGEDVYSVTNTVTWNVLEEEANATFTKAPETGTITPGVPFDVTLTLTNNGPGDMVNIIVRDVLDPSLTVVPDSVYLNGQQIAAPFWQFQGGVLSVIYNGMSLGAGETATLTFQVTTA